MLRSRWSLRATFFARSVACGSFPRKKLRHIGFAPVGLTQRHIPRTLCAIVHIYNNRKYIKKYLTLNIILEYKCIGGKMLEIFVNYSSKLFYVGLLLSFLMIIPMIFCIITNYIIIKKLPQILLDNGYITLSEKIKNVKIFIANDPKLKKWQDIQLIYKEFRHLNIIQNNKRLKIYQNMNKFYFILSFIFSILILITGWVIGFSLIGAFITSIVNNENIGLSLLIVFFVILIIFVCILLTKYLLIIKKYY